MVNEKQTANKLTAEEKEWLASIEDKCAKSNEVWVAGECELAKKYVGKLRNISVDVAPLWAGNGNINNVDGKQVYFFYAFHYSDYKAKIDGVLDGFEFISECPSMGGFERILAKKDDKRFNIACVFEQRRV
jgi:hypothetical protein